MDVSMSLDAFDATPSGREMAWFRRENINRSNLIRLASATTIHRRRSQDAALTKG